MPEMAMAREHHGYAMLVARFDAFIISNRAAWLNDRGNAVACEHVDIVAEREKRIGRSDSTLALVARPLAGELA